jgi:hypothetical protein
VFKFCSSASPCRSQTSKKDSRYSGCVRQIRSLSQLEQLTQPDSVHILELVKNESFSSLHLESLCWNIFSKNDVEIVSALGRISPALRSLSISNHIRFSHTPQPSQYLYPTLIYVNLNHVQPTPAPYSFRLFAIDILKSAPRVQQLRTDYFLLVSIIDRLPTLGSLTSLIIEDVSRNYWVSSPCSEASPLLIPVKSKPFTALRSVTALGGRGTFLLWRSIFPIYGTTIQETKVQLGEIPLSTFTKLCWAVGVSCQGLRHFDCLVRYRSEPVTSRHQHPQARPYPTPTLLLRSI